MTTKLISYNPIKYPFRETIEKILQIKDLELLHENTDVGEIVKPGKDNHSLFHNRFYADIKGSTFETLYHRFIKEFIRPLYDGPIIYQSQTTFRIQYVGNLGVGAFHRDSDYNHPFEEVNYWLPMTRAFGNNTIWLESEKGRKDYHPERVSYGEVLVFPGGELMHGNKVNDTKSTRVSFDFRVIPKSSWIEPKEPKAGITFGRKFIVGEYYKEMD